MQEDLPGVTGVQRNWGVGWGRMAVRRVGRQAGVGATEQRLSGQLRPPRCRPCCGHCSPGACPGSCFSISNSSLFLLVPSLGAR